MSEAVEPERCECGVPIAEHPPLPKPKPFPSWRQGRATKPTSKAGPLVKRSFNRWRSPSQQET